MGLKHTFKDNVWVDNVIHKEIWFVIFGAEDWEQSTSQAEQNTEMYPRSLKYILFPLHFVPKTAVTSWYALPLL